MPRARYAAKWIASIPIMSRHRRNTLFPKDPMTGLNYNDPRVRERIDEGVKKLVSECETIQQSHDRMKVEYTSALNRTNLAVQREQNARDELSSVKATVEASKRENEAVRREAEATRREAESTRREAEAARREAELARREEACAKLEAEKALSRLVHGDVLRKPVPRRRYKTGAVVTSHGDMGAYAQSCLGSLVTFVPEPRHIVLYINEGTDPIFDTFVDKFPDVEIIRVDDQEEFGGLTGTWNAGSNRCLQEGCEVVMLVNGDTHVGPDIVHLTDAAAVCHADDPKVFGPCSNAPGPLGLNLCQAADGPSPQLPYEATQRNRVGTLCYGDLNGYFLCFPAHVMQRFRYNEEHCFDPAVPWAQNETTWYRTHCPHVFKPIESCTLDPAAPQLWVVPRTHVYHHKHAAWRKQAVPEVRETACLYTVVTGSYEAEPVWSPRTVNADVPCFYLSDDPRTLRQAASQGWIPLMTGIWMAVFETDSPKVAQRSTKAAPYDVLPRKFTASVYMDGNCAPAYWGDSIQDFVDRHLAEDVDLVCWQHPDRQKVHDEARAVVRSELETPERVETWMSMVDGWGFEDDQGLTETRVLVRRHHNLIELADTWRAVLRFCFRDQLLFDPLVWRLKVACTRVPVAPKHDGIVLVAGHSGAGRVRRFVEGAASAAKISLVAPAHKQQSVVSREYVAARS
jgi:hypothetical protein